MKKLTKCRLLPLPVFLIACSSVSESSAQNSLHVPVQYSTIQAAIEASANGDEIVVGPGTYTESIDFLGKAVHVRSAEGPEATLIDVTGQNARAVQAVSGEGPDTILDGFTITGGSMHSESFPGNSGGGMYIASSSPTIINCIFTANSAEFGGGIFINASDPFILFCTFHENVADRGGGIYNFSGSNPTIEHCTFAENMAEINGGGMYNHDNCHPTITHCTFSANAANASGGGMFNFEASSPVIEHCEFYANTSGNNGGAMLNNEQSKPSLTDCVFEANFAESSGGGVFNQDNSDATFNNSVFRGNFAGNHGAGMFNNGSSPALTNCLFTGNQAANGGGGMYNWQNSDPLLTNCTFSGNVASFGGGIRNFDDCSPTVVNSILWGNEPSQMSTFEGGDPVVNYTILQGGWDGAGGVRVLDTDPLFINPNGSDGVPGTVHDDLRLTHGSPAIDTGINSAVPEEVTTDLDGTPRILDGTGEGVPVVDMGAYEFSCLLADLSGPEGTPDGIVDIFDLLWLISKWGPCNDPNDCPADLTGSKGASDGEVDIFDLLLVISAWNLECN